MSIKVMTLVWDRFPEGGSKQVVMLALADWCNDDGGSLYPSIEAVAGKARLSDKQARRIMHELQDEGYLVVVGNARGGRIGSYGLSKHYVLNVAKLASMPMAWAPRQKRDRVVHPPADGRVTPALNSYPPADGSVNAPDGGIFSANSADDSPKTADLGWGSIGLESSLPSHGGECNSGDDLPSHGGAVHPPMGGRESVIEPPFPPPSAGASEGEGEDKEVEAKPKRKPRAKAPADPFAPEIVWDGERLQNIGEARLARWAEEYPLINIQQTIIRQQNHLRKPKAKKYKDLQAFMENWFGNDHKEAELVERMNRASQQTARVARGGGRPPARQIPTAEDFAGMPTISTL